MQAQPEATPLVQPQNRAINTTDNTKQSLENGNTKITRSSEHLEHAQAQKDFQSAIHTLKENCLQGTGQLSDLKQTFRRPNPGEGHKRDLTMDEIYVNIAIHEGRAHQYFAKHLDR